VRFLVASRKVLLPRGEIAPAVIEIDGGRIVGVYESATDAKLADADVDYGDHLITPALVNAHTHLALTALRTCVPAASTRGNVVEELFFRFEEKVGADDVRAFVRLAAYESLLAGVGVVWDHYYFGRAVAEGLRDAGLAGVVAPTLQDLAGPGRSAWEAQLAVTAEIDGDESLAAAGIAAALGPHATDTVSDPLLERAIVLAETRDLPLHMHLGQSLEEYERALASRGTTPTGWLERQGALARASVIAAHAIFASDDDLSKLRGHTLVWCPHGAAQFGFPARPDRWAQAGVAWALGTDCAATNDAMSPQAELRALASLRAAAASFHPAYEAFLRDGELDAARGAWAARTDAFDTFEELAAPLSLLSRVASIPGALHPRAQAGTIAPSALANLAVWDLAHPCLWPGREPLRGLVLADATKALHALWVVGRRIGADGALSDLRRSPEYREALREANARLAKLLP
jgi:5-methylthioadenosine/S-adenosylhomocysteine deaminase